MGVAEAIEEIQRAFPSNEVLSEADGQGGAAVIVEGVELGDLYRQADTWIGFRVAFNYPYADVYPHYVRADLVRKDGRVLGDGISGGHTFCGRESLQLSRRSNRLNPAIDTAALKLLKVVDWLRSHP